MVFLCKSMEHFEMSVCLCASEELATSVTCCSFSPGSVQFCIFEVAKYPDFEFVLSFA